MMRLFNHGLKPKPEPSAVPTYMRALVGLPLAILENAIVIGLLRWTFYPSAPEIVEVVDECRQAADYRRRELETRAILNRDAKPPNWEPLTQREVRALYRKFEGTADLPPAA